jgi:hypothetical protein
MKSRLAFIFVGAFLALWLPVRAHAQKTYYIGISSDYAGGSCHPGEGNTPDDTTQLKNRLAGAGWQGTYVANEQNLPSRFVDGCISPGGDDELGADAALLSVYSGHGHVGMTGFSDPQWGFCDVHLGWAPYQGAGSARLGSMNGSQAGYAVWSSSCTLNLRNHNLENHVNWQWTQQQFGFHNSPSMGKYSLRAWWDDMSNRNNADAWLTQVKFSPFGNLINTPVAISYGPTENWCWAVHRNANLKNDTYRYPRGGGPECGADWQPEFWWCATWSNERESCECGAC